MKKKPLLIIAATVIAIIGWFVLAHYFGPTSERGIEKEVSRLREDSVKLQGNFSPRGQYDLMEDVLSDFNKIKKLGQPLRYGNTEIDSTRLFGNPRTAKIAKYNIAKCDSVLSEVEPLWRATAILTLSKILRSKNENTIIKQNDAFEEYTGIEIYSIRYLSKEELEKDAKEYNHYLMALGFKSVIYATTPESEGVEYTLNK